MGGRAAVIVPDGVLFGLAAPTVEIRGKIIRREPAGHLAWSPCLLGRVLALRAVSTAVLLFTRGGRTDKIWFYDMAHDGFSLDDKRVKVAESDIPDILECWKNRFDRDFQERQARQNRRIARAAAGRCRKERAEVAGGNQPFATQAKLIKQDVRGQAG